MLSPSPSGRELNYNIHQVHIENIISFYSILVLLVAIVILVLDLSIPPWDLSGKEVLTTDYV